MCKLVADLVGADKQVLREIFARLEKRSGEPGVDIRLTGEIYGKIHMKTRELGLDPADSTHREVYQSLLNMVALHDQFLVTRLGIENPQDPTEVIDAVIRLIKHLSLPKQSWVIKSASSKRLLKATPPKVLMKLLHYRSLDSMLKREQSSRLLAAARHTEPSAWQEKFVHSYNKLTANDFEARNVNIDFLCDKHWQAVGQFIKQSSTAVVVHTPESGSVIFLPIMARNLKGLTITTLLASLHYINDIRAFSTYCKFNQLRPDFGSVLTEHLLHNKQDHVNIAGQPMHWRIIHNYYARSDSNNHPEVFEPHLQPEDLAYRKAEIILYHLEPALKFWHDMDYVGMHTETGPISFSLTDMAMNLVNNVPYENRVYYHMQDALWDEVFIRYVGQRTFEEQILGQLDEQTSHNHASALNKEIAW